MPSRLEVSPPSGIFIAQTDLPNAGASYTATNETGTAQTLRVSWATSVNVRAQLHGDNTILDGMRALWTLEPFSRDMQILTLRKLRAEWVTGTGITADLISGMRDGWVWPAYYIGMVKISGYGMEGIWCGIHGAQVQIFLGYARNIVMARKAHGTAYKVHRCDMHSTRVWFGSFMGMLGTWYSAQRARVGMVCMVHVYRCKIYGYGILNSL